MKCVEFSGWFKQCLDDKENDGGKAQITWREGDNFKEGKGANKIHVLKRPGWPQILERQRCLTTAELECTQPTHGVRNMFPTGTKRNTILVYVQERGRPGWRKSWNPATRIGKKGKKKRGGSAQTYVKQKEGKSREPGWGTIAKPVISAGVSTKRPERKRFCSPTSQMWKRGDFSLDKMKGATTKGNWRKQHDRRGKPNQQAAPRGNLPQLAGRMKGGVGVATQTLIGKPAVKKKPEKGHAKSMKVNRRGSDLHLNGLDGAREAGEKGKKDDCAKQKMQNGGMPGPQRDSPPEKHKKGQAGRARPEGKGKPSDESVGGVQIRSLGKSENPKPPMSTRKVEGTGMVVAPMSHIGTAYAGISGERKTEGTRGSSRVRGRVRKIWFLLSRKPDE